MLFQLNYYSTNIRHKSNSSPTIGLLWQSLVVLMIWNVCCKGRGNEAKKVFIKLCSGYVDEKMKELICRLYVPISRSNLTPKNFIFCAGTPIIINDGLEIEICVLSGGYCCS
jgi:hypothetical protein